MKIIVIIILAFVGNVKINGQGGIDHIKNQSYMRVNLKIDCNDRDNDNLSEVICANLKFQKSDSLLVNVYTLLLRQAGTDSARNYIVNLQTEWRAFRDKHCQIVWNQFEGGVGFTKSIAYLNCLAELTNHRRIELESLVDKE